MSGCLTPMMVLAPERSRVMVAPAAANSRSVKTRFDDGCTSTSTPELTSRETWEGVSGARRSHLEYASARTPRERRMVERNRKVAIAREFRRGGHTARNPTFVYGVGTRGARGVQGGSHTHTHAHTHTHMHRHTAPSPPPSRARTRTGRTSSEARIVCGRLVPPPLPRPCVSVPVVGETASDKLEAGR